MDELLRRRTNGRRRASHHITGNAGERPPPPCVCVASMELQHVAVPRGAPPSFIMPWDAGGWLVPSLLLVRFHGLVGFASPWKPLYKHSRWEIKGGGETTRRDKAAAGEAVDGSA